MNSAAPRPAQSIAFQCDGAPTTQWPAQQLFEAFPKAVRVGYLLRDRDKIYGDYFRQQLRGLGLKEVLGAPRSPWQNGCVERLIGSIRRGCLDHVIVLNQHHLRRILQNYFGYYHHTRTHLSVDKTGLTRDQYSCRQWVR